MAYVIQPLLDIDAASSPQFHSSLSSLVSPFTFQPLEDKPQNPIFERLSATRQLESLDLDAPSPSVLGALGADLHDYETNDEDDSSSIDSIWLNAAASRIHTLQVSLQFSNSRNRVDFSYPRMN